MIPSKKVGFVSHHSCGWSIPSMSVITKISETFWVNRSPTLTSKASHQATLSQSIGRICSGNCFSSFEGKKSSKSNLNKIYDWNWTKRWEGFPSYPLLLTVNQKNLVFFHSEKTHARLPPSARNPCVHLIRPNVQHFDPLHPWGRWVESGGEIGGFAVFPFFGRLVFQRKLNVDLPHGVGVFFKGEDALIVETIWIWHTYFGLYKLYPFPVVNSTNDTTPLNHSMLEVSEGPGPDSTRIYCRTPGDPLFLLGKGDNQYSFTIEINETNWVWDRNETIPRLFPLIPLINQYVRSAPRFQVYDNMGMCPGALYESLTSIQNGRHIKKSLATHSAFMPSDFLEEKQRFLQ